MAYVYQITNDINGKIYIGKTEFSLEKRFKEHCLDSKKENIQHRPLYAAMKKYGIEHFHIELIEETDNPEERERFWIEQKGSFKKGYNATMGGDGKKYIDYDQVEALYNHYHNCNKVAKIMNINITSVYDILHSRNIELRSSQEIAKENAFKIVALCDNKNPEEILLTFANFADAARYVQQNNLSTAKDLYGISTHIRDACLGRRKTAYSCVWRLLN